MGRDVTRFIMYDTQQTMHGALAQALPFTFGKIFYVGSASDSWVSDRVLNRIKPDRDGVIRSFTSLESAYAATVSGRNDIIILDANTAHSLTAMLSVTKNRVHIWGEEVLMGLHRRGGARSKIAMGVTTVATDLGAISNTGVGNSFRGVKVTSSNTKAESLYGIVEGGEYAYYEDVEIYKDSDLSETGAAELVANGDSTTYKNCFIGSGANAIVGAIIRPCVLFTKAIAGAGLVARENQFKDCLLARNCGNAANRFVYGAAGSDVERINVFENCLFTNNAVAAAKPAQNVAFGAAITTGFVLLKGCSSINADTAMSTTVGVFVDGPVPAADTTGIALQAT